MKLESKTLKETRKQGMRDDVTSSFSANELKGQLSTFGGRCTYQQQFHQSDLPHMEDPVRMWLPKSLGHTDICLV